MRPVPRGFRLQNGAFESRRVQARDSLEEKDCNVLPEARVPVSGGNLTYKR